MGGTGKGPRGRSAAWYVGAFLGVFMVIGLVSAMVFVFDPFSAWQDDAVRGEALQGVFALLGVALFVGLVTVGLAAVLGDGQRRRVDTPSGQRLRARQGWSSELVTALIITAVNATGLKIAPHVLVPAWGVRPAALALAFVGAIVGLTSHILIHELGHVLGGRLVGVRVVITAIGPLVGVRRGGTWYLHWARGLDCLQGFVSIDVRASRITRPRVAVLVAAGPVASAAAGAVAVWGLFEVASSASDPPPTGLAFLAASALALTIGAATTTLHTVVTFLSPEVQSDGSMLRDLLCGSTSSVLGQLHAEHSHIDRRPRQWFGLVSSLPSFIEELSPDDAFRAFPPTLDLGGVDDAGLLLERATQGSARLTYSHRGQAWVEAAYFRAVHSRDPGAARAALTVAEGQGIRLPTAAARAEAAILIAEGAADEGIQLARSALDSLDSDPLAEPWDEPWLRGLLHWGWLEAAPPSLSPLQPSRSTLSSATA